MDLLLFAVVVVIVVAMLCAVWWYVPAPGPLKWIVPAVIVLVGAIIILYRAMGHSV